MRPPADRWVPPPASEKHVLLRRWGISLAVALLLHGVIAAIVVLAWRKLPALNRPGPVVVELAPPPAEPNAQPAEPTFATTSADAGRSDSAERTDIDHPFAQLPIRSKTAEGESEPTFATQNREAIAPAENADEKAAEARTASGGGGLHLAPGAEIGGGPIDTRIAPSFPSFGARGKKAPRKLARSSSPLAHPNKQAGEQGPSRRLSALRGSIVINAIGARVEDRVRAAMARANASGNGARNAVGSTMSNNAGSAANPADGIVTNAIGMAVHVHPTLPQAMNGAPGTGVAASAGARMPAAGMNGVAGAAGVNGSGMGHLASRAGTIGGPAKGVSGVLNGTDFHPRHP
jgi:hypothetical protein